MSRLFLFNSRRRKFSQCPSWKQGLLLGVALGLKVGSGLAASGNNNDASALQWTDIRQLGVEGRGWTETKHFYDRLPARAEKLVRPPVWELSLDSAGMLVCFETDATNIYARWTLTSTNLAMPHMPATGVSGIDLYVKAKAGDWHWAGVGQPRRQTNTEPLICKLAPGMRTYQLYLPLYNGVSSVEIGVPMNAVVRKSGAERRNNRKPIVFYGTSILQGACASRPGMVHSAILGRRFDRPTINLGFSGQGRMEPELADLLAELDPAVYVLDCLPNLEPQEVKERVEPFVRRLRNSHPITPILLVEDRVYANAFLTPERAERHRRNHENLRAAYRNLQHAGVKHLYYVEGAELFGKDGEGSVDGSHPNDLGFMRQADIFTTALKPLLRETW